MIHYLDPDLSAINSTLLLLHELTRTCKQSQISKPSSGERKADECDYPGCTVSNFKWGRLTRVEVDGTNPITGGRRLFMCVTPQQFTLKVPKPIEGFHKDFGARLQGCHPLTHRINEVKSVGWGGGQGTELEETLIAMACVQKSNIHSSFVLVSITPTDIIWLFSYKYCTTLTIGFGGDNLAFGGFIRTFLH